MTCAPLCRQPVVFVSHGAPDICLQPGSTGTTWAELGRLWPRPSAILVISAHWATAELTVGVAETLATLHDFGGFPKALREIRYPAPGSPWLAGRVRDLLAASSPAHMAVRFDAVRGLDHGAWVPLRFMYPQADIPVCQLSIHPHAGPAWHRRLGQALAPLRDEGVLILASGGLTHNFDWLARDPAPLHPGASAFADWVANALAIHAEAELLAYRSVAPYGQTAHPSEEHLMPLFVAWGSSMPGDTLVRLNQTFTYAALAMDVMLWQASASGLDSTDRE